MTENYKNIDNSEIELQQIDMANIMAEMAEIGFVSDANSIRKLSIISILLHAYDNVIIFSDDQLINLKKAYDYVIKL